MPVRCGDVVQSANGWTDHAEMCRVLQGQIERPMPFLMKRTLEFTVVLCRSHEKHVLGLEVRYGKERGLLVVGVGRGRYDLMKAYNLEHPTRAVFKDDLVLKINDKDDRAQMCEEAKQAQIVSLLVSRPAPTSVEEPTTPEEELAADMDRWAGLGGDS
jgi:hypothetical protein